MGKKSFTFLGYILLKSRLISIVSKPIEVVVVVIVVVVFVKKKIGPKMFDPKEIPCPKTLGLRGATKKTYQILDTV